MYIVSFLELLIFASRSLSINAHGSVGLLDLSKKYTTSSRKITLLMLYLVVRNSIGIRNNMLTNLIRISTYLHSACD